MGGGSAQWALRKGQRHARLRLTLTGIAAILALLMFLKFIIIKPIIFLALAILFGVAAFLSHRG